MKKICILIIAVMQIVMLVGCQPKQESNFVPGPADKEPPRFTTEKEMVEHLKGLDEAVKKDCYYQLNTVPESMEFDSYSSYFHYVDWWFFDANVSQEARFIYLRWDFAENGQERLEYDLNENGAGRTELQVGDKTFYYLLIDDPGLYDIEWVQDGYLFSMNIPVEYIAPDENLNESLLLKYTELNKKHLSDTQDASSNINEDNSKFVLPESQSSDSRLSTSSSAAPVQAVIEPDVTTVYIELSSDTITLSQIDESLQVPYKIYNNSSIEIHLGSSYTFERYDGSQWVSLGYSHGEPNWPSVVYSIPVGAYHDETLYYLNLLDITPGEYRLLKYASKEGGQGFALYANFTIIE